jgi:hypothetical protein
MPKINLTQKRRNELRPVMAALKAFFMMITLWPASSFGQNRLGAGVVLGDPTGFTAKYALSRSRAVDAALSFGSGRFYIHSAWLALWPTGSSIDNYPLTWYLGVGPRLLHYDGSRGRHGHRDEDHTHLGARAPIGVRMIFKKPRIELFGEISVTMDVVPETELDFDFGIGARYYF